MHKKEKYFYIVINIKLLQTPSTLTCSPMMKRISLFACTLLTSYVEAQNPFLLKDIMPGTAGSNTSEIVATKSGYTFFNADDADADTDAGLWRTDGTPGGTIKLNLTYPGYISSKATMLTRLNDRQVVFAADNSQGYGEIWVSDGTQAGTIALERFTPSSGSTPVQAALSMNAFVLYGVQSDSNHLQLRRTNGTPEGTKLVHDFGVNNGQLAVFKAVNGVAYFDFYDVSHGGNDILWRSDGTEQGTYQLRDLGSYPTGYSLISNLMEAGNSFYFMTVKFATNEAILFKSNGTAGGTVSVKEISPDYSLNTFPAFAAIGSSLYFSGNDGINGRELWKTDGTGAGTQMVADLNPGSGGSNPVSYTVVGNVLYFSATIDINGDGVAKEAALCKAEGDSATIIRETISDNTTNTAFVTAAQGRLYLSSQDAQHGVELWTSDGTFEGTTFFHDINPGSAGSNPLFKSSFNTYPAYFIATSASTGRELYKLDNPAAPVSFNTKDGNWSDPTTWNNNTIPAAAADVILNHPVIIDVNAECKSLTTGGYNVTVLPGVRLNIKQ